MTWSTNTTPTLLKAIVGCISVLIIVIGVFTLMVIPRPIDSSALWQVCTMTCVVLGIGTWSFVGERKTDYGYIEREGDAQAKIEAAKATAPAPSNVERANVVVQQPTSDAKP